MYAGSDYRIHFGTTHCAFMRLRHIRDLSKYTGLLRYGAGFSGIKVLLTSALFFAIPASLFILFFLFLLAFLSATFLLP